MKSLIIFIILINVFIETCAQYKSNYTNQELKRYHLIKDSLHVESEFLGLYGSIKSKFWQTADSFFTNLPIAKVLSCFKDSSNTLKYYAFLKLLDLDDRRAFEILKENIRDTAMLAWHFDDEMGTTNLNKMLAREYKIFIRLKYYSGGKVDLGGRYYFGSKIYYFPRQPKKIWVSKFNQFEALITKHGIKID
jgi:hypothetical protein